MINAYFSVIVIFSLQHNFVLRLYTHKETTKITWQVIQVLRKTAL